MNVSIATTTPEAGGYYSVKHDIEPVSLGAGRRAKVSKINVWSNGEVSVLIDYLEEMADGRWSMNAQARADSPMLRFLGILDLVTSAAESRVEEISKEAFATWTRTVTSAPDRIRVGIDPLTCRSRTDRVDTKRGEAELIRVTWACGEVTYGDAHGAYRDGHLHAVDAVGSEDRDEES